MGPETKNPENFPVIERGIRDLSANLSLELKDYVRLFFDIAGAGSAEGEFEEGFKDTENAQDNLTIMVPDLVKRNLCIKKFIKDGTWASKLNYVLTKNSRQ